jgi:ribonuclease HI
LKEFDIKRLFWHYIDTVEIYTDGGCSGNPGPGGWAFVIVETTFQGSKILVEKWGAERDTTNNRMELTGPIAALKAFRAMKIRPKTVTVYTDSQYVQKGMTEWLSLWKSKGWINSDKQPVKNRDLWERLDSLTADLSIKWVWVKGHAGNVFNERCDTLAQRATTSLSK